MKNTICTLVFLVCSISLSLAQAEVFGKWKTIDDETGDAKSIVEIFERDGKVYGKIIKLFRKPHEDPDPTCTKCLTDDPRYGQKVLGMEIMKDMIKDGDEYSGGEILKPDEGKIYRCKIWVVNGNLQVRGYLGFFFRTQEWLRVQ